MAAASLRGRVAIVTGANQGIGAGAAVALARRGAAVAVTYLRHRPRDDDVDQTDEYLRLRGLDATETVDAIERAGARAFALEADLADPDVPAELFDAVEGALGPVTVLVHNASGWRQDTFAPAHDDPFGRRTPSVNATTFAPQFHVDARAGALLIAQFAARHRARRDTWGRIVTLTSGGRNGFPGEVSYGAAKAALENYTMSAATELAPQGITANVVHPPVTDTGWVTDEVRRFIEEDGQRIASPDDVGELIAWLCTDEARLVTGNVLRLR